MSNYFLEDPFNDLLFKNWFNSNQHFRILDRDVKTGYPVDIFFENLDSDNPLLKLEFALPGADPSTVKVTRSVDGELRVRYDKPDESSNKAFISRSISRKSFDLSWKISAKFDLGKMETYWYNGLLTLVIPQKLSAIPESVEVKILSEARSQLNS